MSKTEEIIILLPVLLVSISIHETMHALASYFLGDDTAAEGGRISLNPLKHIDPYLTVLLPLVTLIAFGRFLAIAKPVQVNFSRLRWGEFGGAIVGAVGPLSNLFLALICAVLFMLFSPQPDTLMFNVLTVAALLNIILLVINLIPWPPLDGSRILYAFSPEPMQRLMQQLEYSGILTLVIFLLLFYSSAGNAIWGIVTSIMNAIGVPMPMIQ